LRNAFIRSITEQAKVDDRIFLIVADLGYSVVEEFAEEFPDRFINAGIAEQNAMGLAAGLALSGKLPYFYGIIPFVIMRCFEQVRIDVAYMNTNVRIVGVGAGLSYGPAGTTHHAIEDIAIMRALPNMTICCPGDPIEARELIRRSFTYQGPIYFRLGKNGEPCIHSEGRQIEIGMAIKLTEGNDLALITTSNMLEQAKHWVDGWKADGISTTLLSVPTIKPLDISAIKGLVDMGMPVLTLEEHNVIGGLGTAVAEIIAESGKSVKFKRIGIPDQYSRFVGCQAFQRDKFGLSNFDAREFINLGLSK